MDRPGDGLCDGAHASEAGVRDIRLNASEDHRVEQIEDLAAYAEPRRRPESEGAAEPEILIPRMGIAQAERQRPRRVAERERCRRRKRVPIDVRRRIGPQGIAVAVVAVDADGP